MKKYIKCRYLYFDENRNNSCFKYIKCKVDENLSKMHKFNETKEYKDWKAGDKVAAAGIGALLATTLGVKYLKPGLLAVAAVFLKKFWFIIFLPFIWLFKLFSGSSKKKKS